MQTTLFESAFITVNLGKLIHGNKQTQEPEQASDDKSQATAISDWSAELKRRRTENDAKGPDARITDADLEDAFFKDFLTATFPADVVDSIFELGQLFFKDTQILGFKKETNPILAFFLQSYVQDNLLKTKLINTNTYKVLHNAIAKHTVADSEFMETSDDNIIYCKNWYSFGLGDMDRYLKLQNTSLSGKATEYSADELLDNRRVLIDIGSEGQSPQEIAAEQLKADASAFPKFTDSDVKLNDLAIAEEIAKALKKNLNDESADKETSDDTIPADLKAFSAKLKTDQQVFVALQAVHLRTGNKAAGDVLQSEVLRNLTIPATVFTQVSKAMAAINISTGNADAFVKILLNRLSEINK